MGFPNAIAAAQLEALHTRLSRAVTELLEIRDELGECKPHTLGPMSPADFDLLKKRVEVAHGAAAAAWEQTS